MPVCDLWSFGDFFSGVKEQKTATASPERPESIAVSFFSFLYTSKAIRSFTLSLLVCHFFKVLRSLPTFVHQFLLFWFLFSTLSSFLSLAIVHMIPFLSFPSLFATSSHGFLFSLHLLLLYADLSFPSPFNGLPLLHSSSANDV